ncbi:folate-binding protein [Fodinicurvata sp. EGI_FJ10296]|uniref:CAF17-like 4Fe-4S cluster assembly/insertion protein YgfZ n=1 Tax=Fodinicurvata sp. EGI_FJ10296 TaxID=3231908 RepID=UPI003455712F
MTDMTTPKLVSLPDRGLFELGGEERIAFLNGLVSNDMAKLSPTTSLYGTFLTPQGKFLYEFFALTDGASVILDTERERIDEFRKKLRLYKLRSKVTVSESDPAAHVFALVGDSAPAALGFDADAAPGATRHLGTLAAIGDTFAVLDPRHAGLGARIVVRAANEQSGTADIAAALADHLAVAVGSRGDYDRRRIALAVPDASRDMIVEKSALLESNIDRLNGISWDKGCYLGQELTARTHYRGLVKRRLVPLRFADGTPPEIGAEITKDGSVVGDIRSAAGDLVLASVKLAALDGDGPPLRVGDTVLEPLPTP